MAEFSGRVGRTGRTQRTRDDGENRIHQPVQQIVNCVENHNQNQAGYWSPFRFAELFKRNATKQNPAGHKKDGRERGDSHGAKISEVDQPQLIRTVGPPATASKDRGLQGDLTNLLLLIQPNLE